VALPDLAYVREWAKQWKTRKPAVRAKVQVSEVDTLRARIAELEAELACTYSMIGKAIERTSHAA
jgi:hypothetical protein